MSTAAVAAAGAPGASAVRSLADWFVVALLALSTLLAVGLLTAGRLGPEATQASLAAAFVACTVGGLIVAALGRAPCEIAAPAASTTVIYASLGADLAAHAPAAGNVWQIWAAMSLAVVMMGLILLAAGSLRLAGFIKFMPSPVSAGFITGIGLLVVWSQLGPVLGAPPGGLKLAQLWQDVKPASLAVGAVTIAALIVVPRFKQPGPPALIAVIAGTLVYYLFTALLGPGALGGRLQPLQPLQTALATATSIWSVVTPGWLAETSLRVLPYSALLALQALMNAAMSAVTAGNILGRRSSVNRTLVAQGVANLACGALGALPVSTTATLVLASARMKGNPRTVAAGSAATLLLLVLLAGRWLTWLPVAVLASLLLMAGVGMVNQSTVRLVRSAWAVRSRERSTLWTVGIAVVVAAALFWGSVPLALMTGTVLAMVLLAIELSVATRFVAQSGAQLGSRRVWPPEQANWLREHQGRLALFRPQGALFFGTADQLAQQLASTAAGTRFCVLDLSRVTTVDATACEIIATGAKALSAAGVTPLLAGVPAESARCRSLLALGLSAPDPRTCWFADLDRALEHAECVLVEEQWPGLQGVACFEVTQTPLTHGLSEDQLRELKACLKPVDVEAGLLFAQGDAGSSMFIVERGTVEIRIAGAAPGQHTRLAAFGPGSIFGEMSLLMARQRTADAVCTTPARLLELDRASLDRMESESPRLYAALMRNLNVHVAHRLDLATGLVRALQ